jgi:membrane fusion protein, multidrug efflux system
MNFRTRSALRCFCLILTGTTIGCSESAPEVAPPQPPVVPVSQAIQRQVIDYVDFTGRTDAVNTTNIVPRVTGYLVKMPFTEGALVKKDELLFEIDPRPYQAQYAVAEAQVAANEANKRYAVATNERFKALWKKDKGAVSERELDQYQALADQSEANLDLAKANLTSAKLNLDWTKVTSPIDGMVARYFLTLGNLVNQDQTLLTTIVSLDPMYAYFDMDESTLVQIRQAIGEGKIKPAQRGNIPVFLGLQGEQGFPHEGTINFINNQVNPATGSIAVRGVFPNPVLKEGIRLLSPGMFVRIHLPIGQPHPGLLVVDRAIASDQGLKYVYVIDAQNKAQYRRITTGPLQPDGLRVISEGLQPGEWVAVGALQQIRPNMQVQTEKIPMPTFGGKSKA